MKKAGVRGSMSGIQESKVETRKPRSGGSPNGLRVSRFDFRTSNAKVPTVSAGPRALIIGYGNPLRSDDGFGWHASRLLSQAIGQEGIEVITCHQLTPELAEPLSHCQRAVFIDADAAGKPGDIQRRAVRVQAPASSAFTHACTPSGLLAGAKQLFGHRPRAIIITVSAQSFEFGESLSPVVSAALPEVVAQACRWLGTTRVAPAAGENAG